MLQVFNYSDYRQFLKDFYLETKKNKPSFSYRNLSKIAGIRSPNFYQQVIEGKRNLTKSTVNKTCRALKLKAKECDYFENLVFFNQSEKSEDKDIYFSHIIEIQKSGRHRIVKENEYDFYNAWYHCVVRELVAFTDFKEDYSLLARKINPRITSSQAKASVELLLKLGFIEKVKGKYIQTDPVIKTGNEIRNHSILKFNFAMLNLLMKEYGSRKREERLCSSTTIGISEETFKDIKTKMRELRTDILETARKDEQPSKVYQLNMNIISLSK